MARDTAVNDELLDSDEGDDVLDDSARAEAESTFDEEFEGLTDADIAAEGDDVSEASNDTIPVGDQQLDDDAEGLDADRGDGRNAKGEFVGKGGKEAGAKPGDKPVGEATVAKPDAAKPDAKAAADKTAAAGEAAPEPKWEPLVIRSGKTLVPLEEAQLTRANGYHLFSVKDADAQRFLERLNRGHLFEQNRQSITQRTRDLEAGIKELELERAAPQPKSDAEIEADIIVATLGERLAEILEPSEFENMKLRVQLAQASARDAHTKAYNTYFEDAKKKAEETSTPERDHETQIKGVGDVMADVLRVREQEFGGLDEQDVKAVFDGLVNLARAVYWKEGNDWFYNNQIVYDHLKARADAKAKGSTGAPPKNGNTATGAAAAGGAGTTSDGKGQKPDRADQHNRGVDSAARPTSTSLRNRRDSRPPQSGHTRDTPTRRVAKDPAMVAEDRYRKSTAAYMRSDSLDYEEPDEE